MTGLLIVMQRHIIVQIIRKRVRNLANYISSGPSCLGPRPVGRPASWAAHQASGWLRAAAAHDLQNRDTRDFFLLLGALEQ